MSAIDDMIDTLRALDAAKVAEDIAKELAPELAQRLEATLTAGQAPDGKAWEPKKKGGRTYVNAAGKLTVKAHGNIVRATITGPEAYAQFGNARLPVRLMLPDAGAAASPLVEEAQAAAAARVFARVTK